jgi:hypothetical protein
MVVVLTTKGTSLIDVANFNVTDRCVTVDGKLLPQISLTAYQRKSLPNFFHPPSRPLTKSS